MYNLGDMSYSFQVICYYLVECFKTCDALIHLNLYGFVFNISVIDQL